MPQCLTPPDNAGREGAPSRPKFPPPIIPALDLTLTIIRERRRDGVAEGAISRTHLAARNLSPRMTNGCIIADLADITDAALDNLPHRL